MGLSTNIIVKTHQKNASKIKSPALTSGAFYNRVTGQPRFKYRNTDKTHAGVGAV
jgi:hypothetical protein